jgi:hypothetical protein
VSIKRIRAWGTVAVLVFLIWTAGSVERAQFARAHPPADQSMNQAGIGISVAVTPLLQYQARLTDPGTGEPVADGTYPMTFRLYNVASGGSWLWMESKDVEVRGGLLSTLLGELTPLDPHLFNGQALWLGIKVGTDAEATPRQPILPVAYALSLVPGAMVQANSSAPALQVNNSGGGRALQVGGSTVLDGNVDVRGSATVAGGLNVAGSLTGGSHTHSGDQIASGTVAEPRIDPAIARDTEVAAVVEAHRSNPGAHHVRYTDNEAWNAVLARDGIGSGLNADLLDNLSASAFAMSGHTHWGESWTGAGTGLSLSGGTRGLVASGSEYGVFGSSSSGQGVYGLSDSAAGVWGKSGLNIGVYGESDSQYGVAGVGKDKGGVYGSSTNGYGVQGYSTNSYAGYFSGGNDHNDLALGGSVGRINSNPADQNSNLILSSNNDLELRLDNDSGENGVLRVKNSGGTDVVTVDEFGTLTAARIAYSSPRTSYFVVGGEGFLPASNVNYGNSWAMGGAYLEPGSGVMAAPVHLPHGAVVTALKVFFYDNATSNLDASLDRIPLTSGGYYGMANVDSSGITEWGNKTDTTISYATIDNSQYSYHIRVYCSAWAGYNLRIMGAVVTYITSEAP